MPSKNMDQEQKCDPFTGLLDSHVRIFDIVLANAIGIGRATLLRHLHWRITQKRKSVKYRSAPVVWIFDSYESWQKELSCFSLISVRRWLVELENDFGLIRSRQNNGKYAANRTKEYTIEYPTLHELCRKEDMKWVHSGAGKAKIKRTTKKDTYTQSQDLNEQMG